ncbi:TetR/AcrR family transcriptional regulator [Nonomuraea africana]|uniref:AcrR family transcriptional regulator n=1 Tax=Nonomuraea africana TaxID=46171 RepID=A0ABR9K991_9ACTN|nr:TetR/AcrR family transcriptional regulator [Nonomuraea africana]MBE1558571.1 AcrR family transcriptional regulator [Nonomuraea africana]
MTTTAPPRRRAPGMSPDQRRAMIVAAALPLVAEYGTAVTTSQIARAAGIGEATVFRVFADKEAVLDACMAEALRPDHAVESIAAIPLDQPLADRLTEAADALAAHLARVGPVAGALMASGHARRQPAGANSGAHSGDRERSMEPIRAALAELFEPGSLRVPADQAAAVFLGLLFARDRTGDPGTAALVEIFMHGALRGERA